MTTLIHCVNTLARAIAEATIELDSHLFVLWLGWPSFEF